MGDVILKALDIRKTYREGRVETEVLKGVSLEARSGELTAVTGKSGSGKSTLLHILGTLDTPSGGDLLFKGQSLLKLGARARARFRCVNLGFVYQFHHLLTDFSALENVMMPRLIAGDPLKDAREAARLALEEVGLAHRLDYRPAELSGGERQRVAIARALCHGPALVLADEPTGNLDAANAAGVFELFTALTRRHGAAVIMVTHDPSLAERCDRIVELKDGVAHGEEN